ncbi:MAG: hypothetical protein P4L49_16270 [Desulfosporosinus sp.]|nr:hypothetical protein [Desulfosporosinus sp.]
MSVFTVVIIVWVIFQVIASVIKKQGMLQTPAKRSDAFKLPDGRSVKDVIQGISRGTWREQLKKAMENGPYQAGALAATKLEDFEEIKDSYVETEVAPEIKGIPATQVSQGIQGRNEYIATLGLEADKTTEGNPGEEITSSNSCDSRGVQLALTERKLVQGVIWAEILGKPHGLRPFSGPRSSA